MSDNPYIKNINLLRGDIAEQDVGAVVSLITQNMEFRGSINQRLQDAAGEDLKAFLDKHVFQPKAADVYAVPGFNLPAKNIIFAIRPEWKDDWDRKEKDLIECCRKALVLAKCMQLQSIAYPPLASGVHGYGKERAARLVIQGILDRLDGAFDEVRIVVPDDETYQIYYDRLLSLGWPGQD